MDESVMSRDDKIGVIVMLGILSWGFLAGVTVVWRSEPAWYAFTLGSGIVVAATVGVLLGYFRTEKALKQRRLPHGGIRLWRRV